MSIPRAVKSPVSRIGTIWLVARAEKPTAVVTVVTQDVGRTATGIGSGDTRPTAETGAEPAESQPA